MSAANRFLRVAQALSPAADCEPEGEAHERWTQAHCYCLIIVCVSVLLSLFIVYVFCSGGVLDQPWVLHRRAKGGLLRTRTPTLWTAASLRRRMAARLCLEVVHTMLSLCCSKSGLWNLKHGNPTYESDRTTDPGLRYKAATRRLPRAASPGCRAGAQGYALSIVRIRYLVPRTCFCLLCLVV